MSLRGAFFPAKQPPKSWRLLRRQDQERGSQRHDLFYFLLKHIPLIIAHLNRMLNSREAFCFHVIEIISESLVHLCVEVCILLDELRREAVEETEQIVRDKHLTVTTRARANANGGNGNLFGDSIPPIARGQTQARG